MEWLKDELIVERSIEGPVVDGHWKYPHFSVIENNLKERYDLTKEHVDAMQKHNDRTCSIWLQKDNQTVKRLTDIVLRWKDSSEPFIFNVTLDFGFDLGGFIFSAVVMDMVWVDITSTYLVKLSSADGGLIACQEY